MNDDAPYQRTDVVGGRDPIGGCVPPVATSHDEPDYRALALQIPVAWSMIDLEGHQILGNDVYAQLFGYQLDEMAQLTVADLTHTSDRGLAEEYLERLIAGDIPQYEVDKRYVRKDGSEFLGHLVASVLCDEIGEPYALIGIITDVTAERAMAQQVARNEERLSKMLTNISETVTLVSGDGSVAATTGAYTEILGYPTAFWVDRSLFDIVHPDELRRALALSETVMTTSGTELTGEFRARHRLGHYEHIELTLVNLLDDPAVGAVVITSRNITERKANERKLVEMRDRAMALANQRAGFVANVSHELRTPLHAVLGLTELLVEADIAGRARLIASIRSEAERLRSTVDDLLDYSRIEAHGITLEPAPFDLPALVDRLLERVGATEFAAGLEVASLIDPAVPTIVPLDEHRLDQILTNLMGNAVKFTREGHVRLEVRAERDVLVFDVIDTGPGIPAALRETVFEPFSQVPGVVSAIGGSGLGLALVRGLVELMGGSVALSDTPGGGTTFRVCIPMVHFGGAVPSSGSFATETAARPGGVMVLVVEDNELNQQLVQQQLDRLGHTYEIVGSAFEALDHLAAPDHPFEIVLMDWQLPDIDGLEATRRIRARERHQGIHVPVVAVTASAMPEDRAECRSAGMDDFLPKPVALAELAAMIERWVPRTDQPAALHAPLSGPAEYGRLDTLIEDLGAREAVASLVRRYLTELNERTRLLTDARDNAELVELRRIGHTLRSTSEMLGAMELVGVCRRLESATVDTDIDGLMTEFGVLAERTRADLQAWLEQDAVTT